MHPPRRVIAPDFFRGAAWRSAAFSIDRKTGRARARHPRQPGAVGGVERRRAPRRSRAGCAAAGASRSLPNWPRELRPNRSTDAPASGQAASCSNTSVAPTSKFAVAQAERIEHVLGRDGNARVDHHAGHVRQAQRQQGLADAGHDAGARGEADRHVGAGQLRDLDAALDRRAQAVELRQQPQRRCGIGRTAADAGRDRQHSCQA